MREALKMLGVLLCLAAMVAFCLLISVGGRLDDTVRPANPHSGAP